MAEEEVRTDLDSSDFHTSSGSTALDLEGDIHAPGRNDEEEEPSTLDEPVSETLKRDLKAVGRKFLHVLLPRESKTLLRDWDLWGPLILCIMLAMMLQGSHSKANDAGDGGPEFAEVFAIVWVGSGIVTLNSKLLGGTLSFFQCVCVLGYCVLPLNVALIICKVLLMAQHTTILFAIRCLVVSVTFVWSTWASIAFLGESQPYKRKWLAVYPIGLFYFVIAWLVVSHNG